LPLQSHEREHKPENADRTDDDDPGGQHPYGTVAGGVVGAGVAVPPP
jgi:hypothetical protein